jgi:hypothetical protein
MLAERDWSAIETTYFSEHPVRFAVIDDFLTAEALEQFRESLLQDHRWHYKHPKSNELYLKEPGGELFAAIIDGMKQRLPTVLRGLDVTTHWAYLHTRSVGLSAHTDAGSVTLNLYLTADEHNREPGTGGLVLTSVRRPPSVSLIEYNSMPWAAEYYERERTEQEFVIPHRCNRAMIFESRLFHRSDRISFVADGTRSMRTNVGILFDDPAAATAHREEFLARLDRADELARATGVDLREASLDTAEKYWAGAGD